MNTRTLAALAALSALAGCAASGTAGLDVAALHTNDAVVSDAAPAAGLDGDVTATDIERTYDPGSHKFVGGWWKDH